MVHRSLTKIQRQFNGGIIFLSTKSSGTVGCLSANTLDIDESKREREEERETHDVSQKWAQDESESSMWNAKLYNFFIFTKEKNLGDLGFGDEFLDTTPKAQSMIGKIILGLLKL